jgi:hypothetical protein
MITEASKKEEFVTKVMQSEDIFEASSQSLSHKQTPLLKKQIYISDMPAVSRQQQINTKIQEHKLDWRPGMKTPSKRKGCSPEHMSAQADILKVLNISYATGPTQMSSPVCHPVPYH